MSVRARAAASRRSPTSIPRASPFQALVRTLVERRVAVTSTLTVFELNTPGRPLPPGTRRAGPAAARAVPAEPGPRRGQHAVDLPAALPQGDGARAGVRPRRRPAHRRHRSHRRRRGHPRLCQPPAARAAGRSRVHAARSDPDRHAERRPLPRTRRPRRLAGAGQAGRPRRRRRRSVGGDRRRPEGGRWCSSRASATTRRSWWRR